MKSITPRVLPTVFRADTVFVEPITTTGHQLELYVDSAGGDWIYQSTADEIGAAVITVAGETTWGSVELPPFRDEAWIPPPLPDQHIQVNPDAPDRDELRPPVGRSGMLGHRWFADRIWEIDYPRERMLLHESLPVTGGVGVPLAFAKRDGVQPWNFARVQVVVDDQTIDLLFDTGAHTRLSDVAVQIGEPGSVIATSFIIDSIAARWAGQHPDWPVVLTAEAGSGVSMIRAPSVRIGGHETGPVWFTQRADANFLEYMSQWTDHPVVGAVGGNAFRNWRMLIDYPAARLHLCSGPQ